MAIEAPADPETEALVSYVAPPGGVDAAAGPSRSKAFMATSDNGRLCQGVRLASTHSVTLRFIFSEMRNIFFNLQRLSGPGPERFLGIVQ